MTQSRPSICFLHISLILFFFFLASPGFGGDKELSRPKAKEIIIEKMKFPHPVFLYLQFNRVMDIQAFEWPKFEGYYRRLERMGWVTIRGAGKGTVGFVSGNVFQIDLTDTGKGIFTPVKKGEDFYKEDFYKAKVCEEVFLEVTGIKKEGNEAEVDYTWKCDNFDKIYQTFSGDISFLYPPYSGSLASLDFIDQKIHRSRAYFELYDDGWRLMHWSRLE